MYLKRFQHLHDFSRPRIAEADNVTMRLQRNEKPDDWGHELYDLIFANAPELHMQRYPDPMAFYEKLSRFLNVPEENLVVTSGIDEAIRTLMTLCCNEGDSITAPSPSYLMYAVYAEMHGVRFDPITFQPGEFMPPETLAENIDATSRILFLPKPSQPVENVYDLDQLRTLAAICRDGDILFAIDEAYHFFGAPSALPLINEFDNLLVLRTFSKAFGAAGIRLGFAAGSKKAIGPFKAFRLAHEANSLSLHVGEVLLDNFDTFVKGNIKNICEGRDVLRQACLDYGLPAWGEAGNFVLIDLRDPARSKDVRQQLADKGIHVKSGFGAPLDRHILVTCGPKEMMRSFFDALVEILESGGKS